MKQSIGATYVIAFVIIFLVITFAFLLGIMSYMKAFRVNSGMLNAIENHEGYNELSKKEISNFLSTIGYRVENNNNDNCPKKNGMNNMEIPYGGTSNKNHRYCIYQYNNNDEGYFVYGVITYVSIDLPVIGDFFEIPVYTESEKIYEYCVRPAQGGNKNNYPPHCWK
jgi:hypothetical protein